MFKRVISMAALLVGVLLFLIYNYPLHQVSAADLEVCIVKVEAGALWGSGIVWQVGGKSSQSEAESGQELFIITNRHIILNNDSCLVTFNDSSNREYIAEGWVVKTSEETDLALVRVCLSDYSTKDLGRIKKIVAFWHNEKTLQSLEAMPLPMDIFSVGIGGSGQPETTEGILSEWDYYYEYLENSFLYTLCPVQRGMSGGGIFDNTGRLLGIVEGGNEATGETLGIPVGRIKIFAIIDS